MTRTQKLVATVLLARLQLVLMRAFATGALRGFLAGTVAIWKSK